MTRDEAEQLINRMLILQAEIAYLDRAMPYVFSGRLTSDRLAEKMKLLEVAKQDLIERLIHEDPDSDPTPLRVQQRDI